MSKIFVSYKYADDQVDQGLDEKYWAEETDELTGDVTKETKATGRAYVNYLEELLSDNNIYKGEKEDEPLDGKTDDQIWEILKPRIHDSTVTLVVISRGMKTTGSEENQWMPTEIRYSLRENDRGGITSATNALLGVVVPDENNSYEYVFESSNCERCNGLRIIKKDYLFNILGNNLFNKENDDGESCQGSFCWIRKYLGDHSYLHLVTLDEFIDGYQTHINKALEIKANSGQYKIEKTI